MYNLTDFGENIMKLIDTFDFVFDEVTDLDIVIDNLILLKVDDIIDEAIRWSNIND